MGFELFKRYPVALFISIHLQAFPGLVYKTQPVASHNMPSKQCNPRMRVYRLLYIQAAAVPEHILLLAGRSDCCSCCDQQHHPANAISTLKASHRLCAMACQLLAQCSELLGILSFLCLQLSSQLCARDFACPTAIRHETWLVRTPPSS